MTDDPQEPVTIESIIALVESLEANVNNMTRMIPTLGTLTLLPTVKAQLQELLDDLATFSKQEPTP